MPVTLRFQSSGQVPGDGAPIAMRGPSLTIGRGQENDIVLPDPDRLISKNHCAIEDQNGNVVVIDFSTNGTFLNYGKVPLGRVPTPLNDGDVLSMGAYEMIVAITTGRAADPLDDLPPPVDDGPVSHGRADAAPDLMDLLDGPSAKRHDFLDDLMGAEPPKGPSQIVREDPIDELSMPAMGGEEDPILGKIPDPLEDFDGASRSQHSASGSDSFRAAALRSSVIPDDWDDDLLAPSPKVGTDPFAAPPTAARAVPDLPPDAFDGLIPGDAPPPKPPAKPVAARPAPVGLAGPDDGTSPFAAGPAAAPPATARRPAPVAQPAPARVAASGEASDAARAFFVGAGAEDVVIPDDQLVATMERLGGVMKAMIEGLRDVLMTRASIKGEFRMERTQISAGGNNPLKFALSPEHAVEMILRPKAKGYMEGSTAVGEALADIKAHEVAMVTGMEAAIRGVMAKLDPKKLDGALAGGGMLSNRKAKLWDEYEKLYAQMAGQADNDFHEFFSKEFSKAYLDQLERLK